MQVRLATNGHFIFIKEGDSFIINKTYYEVLSPFNNQCQDCEVDEEFNTLMDEIIKCATDDNLKSLLEKIKSGDDGNDLYISENEKDYEMLFNVYSKLKKYFDILSENIENSQMEKNKIGKDEIKKITKELEELLNMSLESFVKIANGNEKIKKFSKKINSQLEHKYNVSFLAKDTKEKKEIKLLMLGDALTTDINTILVKNNIEEVFILKAPHHGTISHKFNKQLKAKNILISHSKYRNYGCIDCCFYHCIGKIIYCTNGNNKYKNRCFFNQFDIIKIKDYEQINF